MAGKLWTFLTNLDRRIVFLMVSLSVILPLIFTIHLPISISPESRRLFDRVEEIPDGSTILLTFDYYPSTLAETEPMSVAALRHCWRKNLKIVTLSTVGLGGPNIADRVMATMAEEFGKALPPSRRSYGVAMTEDEGTIFYSKVLVLEPVSTYAYNTPAELWEGPYQWNIDNKWAYNDGAYSPTVNWTGYHYCRGVISMWPLLPEPERE